MPWSANLFGVILDSRDSFIAHISILAEDGYCRCEVYLWVAGTGEIPRDIQATVKLQLLAFLLFSTLESVHQLAAAFGGGDDDYTMDESAEALLPGPHAALRCLIRLDAGMGPPFPTARIRTSAYVRPRPCCRPLHKAVASASNPSILAFDNVINRDSSYRHIFCACRRSCGPAKGHK